MDIEKMIYESAAESRVDRDDVRRWVVGERKRADRNFVIRSCMLAVLVIGSALFLYRAIDSEMQKVKAMVHLPRSAAMVTLEEVVEEVCGEPPAEFWIRQLGDGPKKRSFQVM